MVYISSIISESRPKYHPVTPSFLHKKPFFVGWTTVKSSPASTGRR